MATKKIEKKELLNPCELTVTPIGVVRSSMRRKFDAPHQPDRNGSDRSVIELSPQHELEVALSDLAGFDYIWLLFWFHKNSTWRPKVQPPRGEAVKRGVFATRSPHRPNPIGLTAVPLISITGRQITIGSCDLIDGTPILDIKPYIPAIDSFPDSKIGWLKQIEESLESPPAFTVELDATARRQATWLKARELHFLDKAIQILERDPSPNRTRRIRKFGAGLFRMGCGEWRIFFSREGSAVTIHSFQPGYPLKKLESPGSEVIPERESQLSFFQEFAHEIPERG